MRRNEAVPLFAVLTTVLLAAGCASTSVEERPGGELPQPPSGMGSAIAELALSMVGVPYRYGGEDPQEGFDCSGLVHYAYASNGLGVPRTSRGQFDAARKIPLADAGEGDLLFFRDQEKLSHVGIYLGDGRFVHAPSSGGSVSVARIDAPYYQLNLVAVGRLLR
jgi:cell wall-associated NlpC family hydrolase